MVAESNRLTVHSLQVNNPSLGKTYQSSKCNQLALLDRKYSKPKDIHCNNTLNLGPEETLSSQIIV